LMKPDSKHSAQHTYRLTPPEPLLKMIPVVMMTSSREEEDLFKSYQLGVNAYVVKPVQFHEFVDAVKQVGGFWAVTNEPPPGSLRRSGSVRT
jgi:DNA-binding NarL/FixJ family response regulator